MVRIGEFPSVSSRWKITLRWWNRLYISRKKSEFRPWNIFNTPLASLWAFNYNFLSTQPKPYSLERFRRDTKTQTVGDKILFQWRPLTLNCRHWESLHILLSQNAAEFRQESVLPIKQDDSSLLSKNLRATKYFNWTNLIQTSRKYVFVLIELFWSWHSETNWWLHNIKIGLDTEKIQSAFVPHTSSVNIE